MSFSIFLIFLCSNSIFIVNGGVLTMSQERSSSSSGSNSWIYDGGRFLKYLWDDCSPSSTSSMLIKSMQYHQQHNANDHKIINDTHTNNDNNDNAPSEHQQYNSYYHIMKKIMPPSTTIECLKRKSLMALDRALEADVIPLVDNIEMVRYLKHADKQEHLDSDGGISDRNILNNIYRGKSMRSSSMPEVNIEDNIVTEKNLNVTDWKTSVIMRLADVFRTHVVKINFNKTDDTSEFRSSDDNFLARRRRHRNMMPIMMFGTLAMGMLLVPMGFKFLAVLGGKALLLAKMALLLASIQGLKRIATSGVNYGLYSQYPGWHERHGRVEVLNGASPVPFNYDAEPIYERVPQADLQMTVGGR